MRIRHLEKILQRVSRKRTSTTCLSFFILLVLSPTFLFAETVSMVRIIDMPTKKIDPSEVLPQDSIDTVKQIELTVTAPFSTARLTIFSDGYIRYQADSSENNIHQNDSKKISSEEFQDLARLIISSHFDTLQGSYTEEKIVDAISYSVTVGYSPTKRGSPTSVSMVNCNYMCPPEVNNLISSVKKLWGKDILEIGI